MRASRFLHAAQQTVRSARQRFVSQPRTWSSGKKIATIATGMGLSLLAGGAALAQSHSEGQGQEDKAELDPSTGRFVSPNGRKSNDIHPDRHPNWRWFLWNPTPWTGYDYGTEYYNDDLPDDITFWQTFTSIDVPRFFEWCIRGWKDYLHSEADMIAGHAPVLPAKPDDKKLTLVVERIATFLHVWEIDGMFFDVLPRLHWEEFNEAISKIQNMERVMWVNMPRNLIIDSPVEEYSEPGGPESLESVDPYLIYDHYLADDDFTLFRFHTYRNLLRLNRDMRRLVFLTIDHENIALPATKRWGMLTKRDRPNCMFVSDSVRRWDDHSLRHAMVFLQKLDYYAEYIDDVRPKIAAWNANPRGNHFEEEEAIAGVVTDPNIVTPLDAPDKFIDPYDPDIRTFAERLTDPWYKHPY